MARGPYYMLLWCGSQRSTPAAGHCQPQRSAAPPGDGRMASADVEGRGGGGKGDRAWGGARGGITKPVKAVEYVMTAAWGVLMGRGGAGGGGGGKCSGSCFFHHHRK